MDLWLLLGLTIHQIFLYILLFMMKVVSHPGATGLNNIFNVLLLYINPWVDFTACPNYNYNRGIDN